MYDYGFYHNKTTDELLNIATTKMMSYSYPEQGNRDRLITFNGMDSLTYDNFGNPQQWFKHVGDNSYLRYGLSWSKVNRLTEITDTETNSKYEYTYDYNGIRTSKKVGNTLHKYYLDGSNIIAETRTVNGVVNKLKYYYGTMGLVGFNYNGTDYYYQKNIQGDIVRIYNNSGTLYGEYKYDAWGKCTVVTDKDRIATINPFRYRGYYLDNETGLCYLNSRYYDPTVGRFLSPDSLEYLEPETLGGLNLYSYCNNNPVMYYDPEGHLAAWLILAIAGAIMGTVIGGFYGGMTAAVNGQNVGAGILIGAFGGAIMGFAAGVGGWFIGQAIAGIAVGTLSIIGTLVTGLGISFGGGFVGGALSDTFTQLVNRGEVTDIGSIFISGAQWGLLNTVAGLLGFGAEGWLAGLGASYVIGLCVSGIGMSIDVIRNHYNTKEVMSVNTYDEVRLSKRKNKKRRLAYGR